MFQNLIQRLSPSSSPSKSGKRDSRSRRSRRRPLRVENLENRLAFDASFGGFEESVGFRVSHMEVDTDGYTYRVGQYDLAQVDLAPNHSYPDNADIVSLPDGKVRFGFIAKYASDGALIWAHTVGLEIGTLSLDSNNVYVTGQYRGEISVGGKTHNSAGNADAIAIKLSKDGVIAWSTSFAQTSNLEWPSDIDVDSSGNVYVAMHLHPMNLNSIVRLNANGSFAWQRTINTNNYTQLQLEVTATNEIVIGGVFKGTADMDPSSKSRWLSAGSDRSVFVSRFSTSGNLLWTGAFVGSTYNNIPSASWITGLNVDGSNSILVTGGYAGRVDVDPSSRVTNLPIDPNHSQYVAYDDMFAVKLSSTGTFVWARGWQSPTGTYFGRTAADVDKFGNLYITGQLSVGAGVAPWRVDLDPTAGISEHVVGLNTTFVLRLNASGTFGWSRTIGITDDSDGKIGAGDKELPLIAVGPSGELYLAFGVDSAMADLDPGAGSVWLETDSQRIRRRGILRWNQP